MARLSAPFTLTGTFGQLVAYQRKDIPGTLVRTPSSLTRGRFRTDPAFANARRTASEAGGRSKAARALRRVLHPLTPVRDGNWQGALTGALTAVQRGDHESAWGQRSVRLSQHGHLLEGYGLSRRTPFESLVRSPLTCTLDKGALRAVVAIPDLLPGTNLIVCTPEPYFRVVACLGAVPDLFYTPDGYAPARMEQPYAVRAAYSDWRPVKSGAPACTLELRLPTVPSGDAFALVLAVGVLLGTPNFRGDIHSVPYRGSGRIMRVV